MELILPTFILIMLGVFSVMAFRAYREMRNVEKLLDFLKDNDINPTDEQKEKFREYIRKVVIEPIAKEAVYKMIKDDTVAKWGDKEIMWGDKKVSA